MSSPTLNQLISHMRIPQSFDSLRQFLEIEGEDRIDNIRQKYRNKFEEIKESKDAGVVITAKEKGNIEVIQRGILLKLAD
jgi:hypothetical protein